MFDPKRVEKMRSLMIDLQKKHRTMKLDLGFHEVFAIISQVQLALRHPQNVGATSKLARRSIEAIISKMDESSPGIAECFNEGFPE